MCIMVLQNRDNDRPPFRNWGSTDKNKLNHLLKVMHPVNCRARTWIWTFWSQPEQNTSSVNSIPAPDDISTDLDITLNPHQHYFFSFFHVQFFFFFSFIFISWRLITLQYCSGFCHTLTWISHGFTCVPHPDPPSHLPLHPIPLGLPSAPGLSTCLMHPTWAGDLFHPR